VDFLVLQFFLNIIPFSLFLYLLSKKDISTCDLLGSNRPPKLLSIIGAFRCYPNLVGGPEVVSFLIRNNVYFLIAVEIFIVFVSWKLRLNWLEASVLGLLIVLLTYKVGHQQFFIPWLFMVASLPLVNTESARRLAWCCLPFVFFLSIFQWGYAYGTDAYVNVLGEVRRSVGFVSFPLGLLILISYFIVRRNEKLDELCKPGLD
jgi:hypothetical protein